MLAFGGLALAVLGYTASGFGGSTAPPAGSDSAKGTLLLTKYFPESAANPTSPIFKFSQPVWTDPQVLAKATSELKASSLFTTVAGPLNPSGLALPPADYARLHAALGPAKALPPVPPPGLASKVPPAIYQLVPQHLELHQRRRADGAVLRRAEGRRSRQHGRPGCRPGDPR